MKRGYTLTEVLIAIAVIATISALVVPIAGNVKRSAQQASCLQKLRSLGVAVEGYSIDHAGQYPPLIMGRKNRESSEDEPVLEVALLEYAGGDESSFQCPADQEHFQKTGSSYFWNHQVSGQVQVNVMLLGIDAGIENIPLISDKEAFHGKQNGTNFLYADQSASQKIKFDVGSR